MRLLYSRCSASGTRSSKVSNSAAIERIAGLAGSGALRLDRARLDDRATSRPRATSPPARSDRPLQRRCCCSPRSQQLGPRRSRARRLTMPRFRDSREFGPPASDVRHHHARALLRPRSSPHLGAGLRSRSRTRRIPPEASRAQRSPGWSRRSSMATAATRRWHAAWPTARDAARTTRVSSPPHAACVAEAGTGCRQ